jgi:opacity protein-like surface antigen
MHRSSPSLLLFSGLLCLLALAASPAALGQTDDGYEPVPPPKSSPGKIGGAIGYTPGWLMMDVDALNATIVAAGGTPFDGGTMMLNGGQGYAYILLVQNLRLGGVGMSGTRSTSRIEEATNTHRDVELSVGYGGVTVEYTVPVVPRLDLTVGTVLGAGGMSITMRRDQGGAKVWDDLWDEFGSTASPSEYSRTMDGSFFTYQPSVTLEFALMRWLGVRAGVGYLGMAGGSWELDGAYDLAGVPDDISANGWMINAGIYLGTFIY